MIIPVTNAKVSVRTLTFANIEYNQFLNETFKRNLRKQKVSVKIMIFCKIMPRISDLKSGIKILELIS